MPDSGHHQKQSLELVDSTATRRTIVKASGAAALAGPVFVGAPSHALEGQSPQSAATPGGHEIDVSVNGRRHVLEIDPRTSLLDLLRETLALTGAKKGCDHGQCGACTVHVDGRRVAACLTLAAKVDGAEVMTIEGLSDGRTLHPMQQAFIDHDALQCGYCTPGQIMAAVACVKEGHARTDEDIREFMSGNICRCGAYVGIVAAVRQAASRMRDD